MRLGSGFLFSLVLAGVCAAPAAAQEAGWGFGASFVGVNYDLSGTGNTVGFAARATRDVAPNLEVEFRGLIARPDQQFGDRSTLFVPEAQLKYRWNIARVAPFVGVGGGLAMVKSPFRTDWDPTLSASAGTGVRLTDRLDLIGELRLRGIEWGFTGSTAEWSAGLAWRFPSF